MNKTTKKTKEMAQAGGFTLPEYAKENRIPLKDQPLSDYRWVAFKKGFNTIRECASFFKVNVEDLQREVRKLKKGRPTEKDISGCIDVLCRRVLFFEGKPITQAEICRMSGLSRGTVSYRTRAGWSASLIMRIPSKASQAKKVKAFGKEYESISALARDFGMPVSTVYSRIKNGMTPEDAVTKPIRNASKQKELIVCFGDVYETYAELAKKFGIKEGTLIGYMRKHKDMSIDDIIFDLSTNPKALYAVNGSGYESISGVAKEYDVNSDSLRRNIRKADGEDFIEDILDGMIERKRKVK